jgi:proteasome lid subunit RPN8/RPN11
MWVKALFVRNVLQYDCQNYPVRFCGSVAKKYSSMLKQVSTDLGITIENIIENPVEGLIRYHRERGQL